MIKIRTLLLVVLFVFSFNLKAAKSNLISVNDSIVFLYLDSISYYIDSLHIEEKEYVLAQAIYETGWFSCKNCAWNRNNAFGFRRLDKKYMSFSSLRECVIYYANWQNKRYPVYKSKFPGKNYLHFLVWCKYAESNEYISKIEFVHRWILNNWSMRKY